MTGRRVLITGGAGFIGCNLADRLALQGDRVIVYDSLVRPGTEANARWLAHRHGERIEIVVADILEHDALSDVVDRADAVVHLAAQVAVTTSLVNPLIDFAANLTGTIGILELVRASAHRPAVILASTNKVYGNLEQVALERTDRGYVPADAAIRDAGISEAAMLNFKSPYGCSKGAADQYVLDYASSFGLKTLVFRMSCVFGERQTGSEDQGWVAHFARRAAAGDPITLFGDGWQVRDLLDVRDCVDAYVAGLERIDTVSGQAFNLGGGPANAVSLRHVIEELGTVIGRDVPVEQADWRTGDQRWYVSDTRAARAALGLKDARPWREGLDMLVRAFKAERGPVLRAVATS
ncbi:SDR family NAD(P)-dependent oxidoreductase [Sphingomonas sp.]|uniref:SDR family NAD(P)-dependent oxidoreductase n=1 Tax=Sphingomonas sp. TaxID=28214 RepID=UPI002BF9D355|nr:SDR family NAD(P)-dependent oxidoreductase [Sphingomonas sp.]HTG38930.1 SDR family NAD(P)-dependent oxidoreductase [Sphingomonas sp.]